MDTTTLALMGARMRGTLLVTLVRGTTTSKTAVLPGALMDYADAVHADGHADGHADAGHDDTGADGRADARAAVHDDARR